MMFDDLVKKNDVDMPQEDIDFVKALIAGEPARCGYVVSLFVEDDVLMVIAVQKQLRETVSF
jgi:hypothetical protein